MNPPSHHFILTLVCMTLCLFILLPLPASAAKSELARQHEMTAFGPLQSDVDGMQPGWNLGNSLDTVGTDETYWGNPRVTRELIQQIAAQGYRSIRIPVTWDGHIGDAPDYTVDPAYMGRVQEVVQWALDANLYVVVNVHHDSYLWISQLETDHDQVLSRYKAVWTQIAKQFKDEPRKLMLESVNEPRFHRGATNAGDMGSGSNIDEARQLELLHELNTAFVKLVRETGGNNSERPLVLPTLESSPTQVRLDSLQQTIAGLKDHNLIATVHYYGYWPFSVNIAGHTTFDTDTKNDAASTFNNVYNTLVIQGIPVILGEYGLLGFDKHTDVIEQGEKLKYFEFIGHQLKEKKITSMLWDNGQHLNRLTFQWADPDLFQMIQASWTGRSAAGESDLLYFRQGSPVGDRQLTIKLNGNKLVALYAGDQLLKAGTDYSFIGNTLTVKSTALSRMISSTQKLGNNGIITAKFNQGAKWKWNVIVSTEPKLGHATGKVDSFSIPTQFQGDQLATMEAVYTSGENTAPQDWTPYKEFLTTFAPSYETNEIKLQPDWLKELHDGQIELTFHFWSGELIRYTLIKNGNQVTGKVRNN
ncbi:cellulase family glycosylhydrolase [Paenibacillus sp. FSL F4-0087]|uniref:cellulase family glycosylhydrolase n=1 Tax=Paenibacillus sp. FSL F4-0087 TaxID=2921368 RepID=UPI00096E7A10|nr:cellulase [Paenibacillus pabuli]